MFTFNGDSFTTGVMLFVLRPSRSLLRQTPQTIYPEQLEGPLTAAAVFVHVRPLLSQESTAGKPAGRPGRRAGF